VEGIELNAYAGITLGSLVGAFAVKRLADLLNLRALAPAVPPELADVYDAQGYARSQQYTRARTRFGIVQSSFDLAVLLIFWLAGGFGWGDELVRSLGWGEIPTGLLFIGLLVAANGLLGLPFAAYSTFVIEQRFGFNRTDLRTFVLDLVRGAALGIALGAPVLAAVIAFFQYLGPFAWLYAWAGSILVVLALQYVLPTWILPLFNRYLPLPEGELREALFGYARSVGFSLREVFVMDGSKRSSKSNAFFTGFGRNRRIALFDTLIERHPIPELVAVLAHEIGHYKRRHVLQGMVLGMLHTGVLLALLSVFLDRPGLFAAFGVASPSVYAGILFFGLLLTPIELLLSLGLGALSRRNEYQADRYAASTTGRPEDLVSALKRLSADNLSNLTPHPYYVAVNYSHPPVLERIRALARAGAGRQPQAVTPGGPG